MPFHGYCMTIEILHAQWWSFISLPEFLLGLSNEQISTKQNQIQCFTKFHKKKPCIDIAHYQLPLCMFRSWTSMTITWCAFRNMFYSMIYTNAYLWRLVCSGDITVTNLETTNCASVHNSDAFEKFQTLVQQDHFPNRKISYRVL